MLGGLIATHWSWEWVFYLSGISKAKSLVFLSMIFLCRNCCISMDSCMVLSYLRITGIASDDFERRSVLHWIESDLSNLTSKNKTKELFFWSFFLLLVQNYSIPWKDILTSFPVWAIIAAHFGTNCCIYVIFTEFPTFLTQALGYRLDQVCFLFFYSILKSKIFSGWSFCFNTLVSISNSTLRYRLSLRSISTKSFDWFCSKISLIYW